MTIGELATRAGVNVQTVRCYERRGLLADPHRTPSGYREYAEGALDRLRLIRRAQELGFDLQRIKHALTHLAGRCHGGRGPVGECPLLEALGPLSNAAN